MAAATKTKVVMKGKISGTRDGKTWPDVGDTIDLPKDEADRLIRQGMAKKAGAKDSD